jgi:V-type H+-transporting ATPase subunit a
MDPTWNEADNSLTFTNSLKMKISVIIGVIQMIFGVMLKGINDTIQVKITNFLFEFIPQIIFMISLLGYMIYMIFYKWLTKFENRTPPSIITIMINIIIKKGSVDGNPLLENIDQEKLNEKILFICIVCSFIMFFCKPIIDYIISNIGFQGKKKFYNKNKENKLIDNEENPNDADNIINSNLSVEIGPNQQVSNLYDKQRNKIKNNDEIGFVDMMVEQMIITIEFILGSVSNTASYLRLWALSLAHSQLSKVFIEKTFLFILNDTNGNFLINIFLMFFCFFIFLNITLFVLIFMDALECALHT